MTKFSEREPSEYLVQTWWCEKCGFRWTRGRKWFDFFPKGEKMVDNQGFMKCLKEKHHIELKEKSDRVVCPMGSIMVWDHEDLGESE